MKVAYFIDRISTSGGMERIITIKANYLADVLGYEVHIINIVDDSHKPFFEISNKIKIHYLDIKFETINNYNGLKKKIEDFKKIKEYRSKVESVLFKYKFDICISTFLKEFSFLYKIKDGSKKIIEIHFCKEGILKETNTARFPKLTYLIFKYYIIPYKYKKVFLKYDCFISLTDSDLNKWGVDNGISINNPLVYPIYKGERCYSKKNVLSVGNLSYSKGITRLIEIWGKLGPKYDDWKLTIVGKRKSDNGIEKIIADNNLTNSIKVLPAVSNIKDFYLNNSIYVSSSRHEAYPLVLVESLSFGLPIISFNCPEGPKEIITDNSDGVLVEDNNIEEFVFNLKKMMDSENLRANMGRKAMLNIQRLNLENTMGKWVCLFDGITK